MGFIEIIRNGHVLFGFAGLAAFWIPIFARKGGVNHVRIGRIFKWCAYLVLGLAAISVIYHLTNLLMSGKGPSSHPDTFSFLVFLGYLALVTFLSIFHAIGVLHTKKNPDSLRTPLRLALAWLSIAGSFIVIAFALIYKPGMMIVLLALSPIGIMGGIGTLNYLNGKRISKQAWLYEHLGGMIGAGIAFHTAFFVFGMNQLFDIGLTGSYKIVPWILPAMIGIPATAIWTRKYKLKFGDLKKAAA